MCGADGRKCTDCHTHADTGEYPAAATYKDVSTGPVLDGKSSGSTLRAAFKGNAVLKSDYLKSDTSEENGLCFSCHEAGNDVEAPTSGTMNSLNSINPTNYADCYHNYDVTITRNAKSNGLSSNTSKTFNANCSKCHNNAEPIVDPANNKDKLLLNAHYKDDTRLIARIGILSDISRPLDHDTVLKTTCDNCHGKGKANVAHGGNRSGLCFTGCHSVEQVYSVEAHKSLSWYTNCQTCHSVNRKPNDHPVITSAMGCSTTGCHSNMAVHVRKNEGKCYSGCHSSGDILNQKKADGTLAHKSTMSSFASCRSCHETNGTDAWTRMMNTRGMCFGCHSHKGDISGNAGKSYQGKDWYGATNMNIEVDGWKTHTNPADSKKSYQTKEYIDSSGKVIGTEFGDEEGIFDDMYDTSTAIPSGDGKDTALDNTTKQILSDGMEVSGHQPNRFKNTWSSVATLKTHVQKNFTSIRCSECHNTHATSSGAMGGHTEWILTKKALPGKTGGVAATSYKDTAGVTKTTIVYADNTMPAAAIAGDGSRLITLNDFWSRNELATPVKDALIAYYKSAAGGSMSTEDAETKFEELDYNGITAANVAQATGTAENVGLAGQWGKTVDVFCFRCHDEKQMANKAHQGTSGKKNEYSHKSASLACVNCHLPEIHGGKLEGLLTDRGAYDSNNNGVADANDPIVSNGPLGLTDPFSYSAVQHKPLSKNQYFYWVAYQNGGKNNAPVNTTPQVLGTNVPAAKLFSVKPDPSGDASTGYTGCSTDKSCHVNTGQRVFGEQSGSNWLNWDTDY